MESLADLLAIRPIIRMERGILEAAVVCRDDMEKRVGGSPDKGGVKQLHGETGSIVFCDEE